MLFGYPIEATEDNWLHDCLHETIKDIRNYIDNEDDVPDWPEIIPVIYRERLESRTGLKDRLANFKVAMEALIEADRQTVIETLEGQNEIEGLLARTSNCNLIDDLPESIQEPIKELYKYTYRLLSELGIRDESYHIIHDSMPSKVCPFCGCEYFDAPKSLDTKYHVDETPREALDHYVVKSKYPFAGVNLRNLVPMGHKCNSNYKGSKDVLRNNAGVRRRAFYPYSNVCVKVSLLNSKPFGGKEDHIPDWVIEFTPDSEEVSTWDEIFSIKTRYCRDILDEEYFDLLRGFKLWCSSHDSSLNTRPKLYAAIRKYAKYFEGQGFSDKAFLKAAVFNMIYKHCKAGNERLIKIMEGFAS